MRQASIILALMLSVLMGYAGPAQAQIEASAYTVVRVGEVHEIDYAKKTAVISGYRYSFNGTNGYDLPEVRMLNSGYGAFEMLQPNMRVRVLYRESKHARIVVEMQQVSADTRLGIPPIQ